jgi:two-component system sensor histidine kinase DegS
MWRRHFALMRGLLACTALLLFLLAPAAWRPFAVGTTCLYAAYSIYILVRERNDATVWPLTQLISDTAFLLLCTLLPTQHAWWFTTIVWFYLLILASLLYTWRQVLVTVLCVILFLLAVNPAVTAAIWPAIVAGGGLAVVMALHKQLLQDRLSYAFRRSVLSRTEAEIAREQERQRIAADFHDGPLQSFISFQMRLEIVRKLMARDQEAALSELLQLQDLGRAQVTDLRSFVRGMQPREVTPETLGSEIRDAVEHFERDSGVTAQLFCGDLTHLDEGIAIEVLQIVREALNNVRKHSKASQVNILVEAREGHVDLSVEDDGSGFPFSGSYSIDELEILRLGPKSIQRRVRTLGGDLTLESRPSSGAVMKIRIPAVR